ncbi:MAG: hypothetical protein AB3N20_00655 [Rhizobiaceae bacterium]
MLTPRIGSSDIKLVLAKEQDKSEILTMLLAYLSEMHEILGLSDKEILALGD